MRRSKLVATQLKVMIENALYEQGYSADKQDVLDAVLDTITPAMVHDAVRAELLYLVSLDTDYSSEEVTVRALEKKNHHPEEALEETAEWQRGHLPPEDWWHPDLVTEWNAVQDVNGAGLYDPL